MIVWLNGPFGAGKTTLVRLILGLAMPDGGSIERGDGLRIGYVPQRFDVDPALPMTVARFLAIGVDAAARYPSAFGLAKQLGIDLVQFGIIATVALGRKMKINTPATS